MSQRLDAAATPPQVPTRTLGRSGLRVTRLGLGMAALGRPGYITLGHGDDLRQRTATSVEGLQQQAATVLDAAWDAGVRYLDAARSYGRAEAFLAHWLTERPAAAAAALAAQPSTRELVLGSKWGYTYTADWRTDADVHEVKDHGLATLERQQAESAALLGSQLALYQVHSATTSSGVLHDAAVHTRLAALRAERGWALGLTLSGTDAAETLRRAVALTDPLDRSRPLFDTVQATWNLLEPSLTPLLAEAHAAGMGVIVKEALANGRLTPHPDADAPQTLRDLAGRLACSLDQLALAGVLDQPWADCVLLGAATTEHLHANLGALAVLPRLDHAARATLASVAETPDAYWATRSRLPWT